MILKNFVGNFFRNWENSLSNWGSFLEFEHMTLSAESVFFPLFDEIFHPNFNKFWKIPMNLRDRCAISRKFLNLLKKTKKQSTELRIRLQVKKNC